MRIGKDCLAAAEADNRARCRSRVVLGKACGPAAAHFAPSCRRGLCLHARVDVEGYRSAVAPWAPERVVADGRAAEAGHRRQAGEQAEQRRLEHIDYHTYHLSVSGAPWGWSPWGSCLPDAATPGSVAAEATQGPGGGEARRQARVRLLEAKLAAELVPGSRLLVGDQSEVDDVALLGDGFEGLRLLLGDGLVVADLGGAGAVVAGTDDDGPDVVRNKAKLHEDLGHVDGVLGDEEVAGLGVADGLCLLLEVLHRPDEGLLVGSRALVGALEDGV